MPRSAPATPSSGSSGRNCPGPTNNRDKGHRICTRGLLAAVPYRAQAGKLDRVVEQIGPYKLGTSYEVMKNLAGFSLDKDRSHPEQGIVTAKIIDKRIPNTRTIQRFTFRQGQLILASSI